MKEKNPCNICGKLGFCKIHYDQQYHKKYKKENSKKCNEWTRNCRAKLKFEVLTHYGPNGILKCSWEGCFVDDIDMLSLDHINNDGSKEGSNPGHSVYVRLRREDYPLGFQTLCWNHQWKKEILRKRENCGY